MVKRKLLSIILCLAFLCSTLSALTVLTSFADDTIPLELVENGNFSNGSTTLSSQWSGIDTTLEITETAKYLGLYCLKATPNTSGGTAKAVLTLNAKPDTTYMLHVSTSTGWTNVTYYINDKTISFTDTATGTAYTERSNTSQKNIQTSLFTAPTDGKVEVTFQRVGGIFEIDRVYVTEYGTETPLDLTFEDGTLSNHYVANIDTTTVNSIETEGGNKYLKVHNTVNNWKMGPVFYAATIPGRDYVVSFDINTTNRWSILYITNSIWGNAAGITQVNISDKLTASDHGKWKTVTAKFTAISYFTTFGFKLCENLEAFCLDNIKVVDNTEIPVELVENGNFSDGSATLSSQWSGVDSVLTLSTNNTYLGTKCLEVTPNGTTAKAVLTLDAKANTTYLLHIGTNGNAQNFTYYINDKAIEFKNTADGAVYTEQKVNSAQKGGLTSLFTTPIDTKKITITFEKNGKFNLQRVFVTEYGIEAPLDLTFEDGTISNHYVSNSGSTSTSNTVVTEGANKYLKVSNSKKNWEMGPVFYAATVPDTVYDVSFDINTSSRWANLYITSSIWGNAGGISTVVINNILTDADCGKWKTITTSFTATSYFTTFGFKLSENHQSLCIDNFSIKERQEGAIYTGNISASNAHVADADNLITNQSLTGGLTGSFADMPDRFTLSSDGYCDNFALAFLGNGSEVKQLIKLENLTPSTEYALSFFAKTVAASDLRVAIVRNENGKSIRNAQEAEFDEAGEYRLCGYTFNTDIDTELYLYIGGSEGSVILDDIAVFEASKGTSVPASLPHINAWKAANSVPKDAAVNLLVNGTFENGSDFADGTVVTTQSNSGRKSLEFTANGEAKMIYAKVNVETDTLYYFSTYVMGMQSTGAKDVTFGIYNPQNDEFLAIPSDYKPSNTEIPDSTPQRALTPPSWNGEWYKRGYVINTKGLSTLYIAVKGTDGTVYFDDMVLCKEDDVIAVSKEEAVVGQSIESSVMGCADSANLITASSFAASGNDAWTSIINYDKFISIKEVMSGDWALATEEKEVGNEVYYIRWIDVKSDTQYNFSVMARRISEEGMVAFGIVDNSTKPVIIKGFSNITADWDYYGITFNSGSNTRIGVYICDTGVEAQFDNFRLFESSAAMSLDAAELAAKTVVISEPVVDENLQVTPEIEEEEPEQEEQETKKTKKKVMVKKTVIPGTPGGLAAWEIAVIIGAWLLFAIIVWLAVSFFTKTSVFSKRKKR